MTNKKSFFKNQNAMLYSLVFPNINPIALSVGPLKIHWYGIAYVAGILSGYGLAKRIVKKINFSINLSDFVSNIIIGVIIGGRLGYVVFYDPIFYLSNPLDIIAIWKGGMSFHGGAIGAFLATIYTCKQNKVSIHKGLDVLALCSTPGLFFGRIANFINSELFGRETSLPWGIIFPTGGTIPRHPSQLYEATLEGLGLFIICYIAYKNFYVEGRLFSIFVIGYGICRFMIEFTREPDAHIGLLAFQLSMGQYLSIIMILLGGVWTYGRYKKRIY